MEKEKVQDENLLNDMNVGELVTYKEKLFEESMSIEDDLRTTRTLLKRKLLLLLGKNDEFFLGQAAGIILRAEENTENELSESAFLESIIKEAEKNPKYGLGLRLIAMDLLKKVA